MGYTHYFYRRGTTLPKDRFAQFAADCERVYLKSEIPLASWDGTGDPVFTPTEVSFNGREDCGHASKDLGIVWPSADAIGGVNPRAGRVGSWFAGAYVRQRVCDGHCDHETFRISQVAHRKPWQDKVDPERFDFCKTAYKPYDLLVTACLIIAVHYFPTQIRVSSDGDSKDWEDARRLCQHVLGYGGDFQLPESE